MRMLRVCVLFIFITGLFAGTPLPFSGTGSFQVKGFSGSIGLSDAMYDSYLHWFSGSGKLMTFEIVDEATNRVSIRMTDSNKYLCVQNVEAPDAESSKIKLVALPSGEAFDSTNLWMQFYVEGSENNYKIRSAATDGYLAMSTGAFIRASKQAADGTYSEPVQESAGLTASFTMQARVMNIKTGDIVRIKSSSGGYLGFNDVGDFVITTSADTAQVPQFKVELYDAAANTVSFKTANQSLFAIPTPGSRYGGIPFSFGKSSTETPAQFAFGSSPTDPTIFYLLLMSGINKFYLRSSSSSNKVIASSLSDLSLRYVFSFEPGVTDPKDVLSDVSLLTQLTSQKVREDFDTRFAKIMELKDLTQADWESIGKLLLPYIQAAKALLGWTTPGESNSPSLRDTAVMLLQKIPATFSLAQDLKNLLLELKDVPVFLADPTTPPASLSVEKGDVVALKVGSDYFLGVDASGALRLLQTSVFDPATHFTVAEYNKNTGRLCFSIGGHYLRLVPEISSFRLADTMQLADIVKEANQAGVFSFYYAGNKISFDLVKLGGTVGLQATSFELLGKLSDQQKMFQNYNSTPADLLAVKTTIEQIFVPLFSAQGLGAADINYIVNAFVLYIKKSMQLSLEWKNVLIVPQVGKSAVFLFDYLISVLSPLVASSSTLTAATRTVVNDLLSQVSSTIAAERQALLAYKTDVAISLGEISSQGVLQKLVFVNTDKTAAAAVDVVASDPVAQIVATGYDENKNTITLKFAGKYFAKKTCSFVDVQPQTSLVLSPVVAGSSIAYYFCDSTDISKRLTVSGTGVLSWGAGSLFSLTPVKKEDLVVGSIVVSDDVEAAASNIKIFKSAIQSAAGKPKSLNNLLTMFDVYTRDCFAVAKRSPIWTNIIEDAWATVQNDAKNFLVSLISDSAYSSVATLASAIAYDRMHFKLRVVPEVASLPSVSGNYWLKNGMVGGSGYVDLTAEGVTTVTQSKPVKAPFRIEIDESTGSRRIALFSRKYGKYLTVKARSTASGSGDARIIVEKTTLDLQDPSIWFTGIGLGSGSRDLYLKTPVTGQYLRCGASPSSLQPYGLYAYWGASYTDFTKPSSYDFNYPITDKNNATTFSFEYEAPKSLAITAGSLVQLQTKSGDLLALKNTSEIGLKKASLYDSSTQFVIESYSSSTNVLVLKRGDLYVGLDPKINTFILSKDKMNLRIYGDADAQTISFLNEAGKPRLFANLSGSSESVFNLITPVDSSYQMLVPLEEFASKTMTSQDAKKLLSGILRTFLVTTKKTDIDWSFYVDVLIAFVKKMSVDLADWKLPSVDIVDQGITKRISLFEYAWLLMNYIADPFSEAPASEQNKVRVFMQSFVTSGEEGKSGPTSPDNMLKQGDLVVLLSQAGDKTLFVNDQGIVQLLPSTTKFSSNVHAKILAYDAIKKQIKFAYNNRFFSTLNMAFTFTDAATAPVFTVEETATPNSVYLNLGQGKRLEINDRYTSGCSLESQGTLLKIMPLNPVYTSLPSIKMPSNNQELEKSLQAFITAFESVRDTAVDMMFAFQGLKQYSEMVAVMPSWSLQMQGSVIQNNSPLNYVKTALQTMLTLSVRYAGLTTQLKTAVQTFIDGKVFVPLQLSSALMAGSCCVVKFGDLLALSVDATGICNAQAFVSFFEPAQHLQIDSFDVSTASLKVSLQGKPLAVGVDNKLVVADDAAVLRVMQEPSGGYSLINGQNKKLRYDQTSKNVAFSDTGVIGVTHFVQPDQRVLDPLSGDLKNDLSIFEKALLQVRSEAVNLDFMVSKFIQYVQQASQNLAWYTTTGIDSRNSQTTTRDYAAILLKRVRDASTIFTAVSQNLKDRISAAVKVIEDNSALYARQIDSLDALAKKLTEPSMVVLSSELVETLNVLIQNVMAQGNADLRSTLINKVESYVGLSMVPGLAQASDSTKLAWTLQNVRFLDRLLAYDVADEGAWETKFSLVRDKLIAKVQSASGMQKLGVMQAILASSIKKLVTEGARFATTTSSWRSLKQLLNNFLFDISQQLALAANDEVVGASLANIKKTLDALLVTAGMEVEALSEPVAPTEEVTTSTSLEDESPSQASGDVASSVVQPQQQSLLPGMLGAAVVPQFDTRFEVPVDQNQPNQADKVVASPQTPQNAAAWTKYEI